MSSKQTKTVNKTENKTENKTVDKTENKTVETTEPKKPKAASSTRTPKQPDNKRQLALESAAHAGLTAYFPEIAGQAVYEKLATALNLHILEAIDNTQKVESVDKTDYNPYPSDKYILLADKTSGSSKKKAVNTRVSNTKASAILRGQKPESSKDSDDDLKEETKDDKENDKEETKEEATTKKKNVVTFSKNSKTYLGFLMSRFADEMSVANQTKNIKDNDSFTKFVFEAVPKEISSHLSRHIVCSVNRLRSSVGYMQDRHVSNLLVDNLSSSEHFKGKAPLLKMLGEYTSDYFKLLGHVLGLFCWTTGKSINHQNIETTMRLLDMGNYEYALSSNLLEENEPQYGLSNGVLREMHKFDELLNPPKSEEEKKKDAEERNKKKTSKVSEADKDLDASDLEDLDVEEEADESPKKPVKKVTAAKASK